MLVGKKKFEEKKEHLIDILNSYTEDEDDTLSYVLEKKGNPLVCMSLNGHLYKFKASYNLLIDKDIENFKKYMYIYAKLEILGTDSRGFFRGENIAFFGILMSNNREILDFAIRNIDIIAYEEKKNKYVKSEAYRFLSRTVLLAIKGEWEDVIERANMYLKNPSKASYDKYKVLEFEFLKALAEKNIDIMKESINKMLDIKVARKMLYDLDVAFDFYLHMYVLIYAKIAMYHGFDLGIDSEIAPKELIDLTPASEYPEPYDFMNKFDFKTITPEEWKAWIYEYHPEPYKLEKKEKEGI